MPTTLPTFVPTPAVRGIVRSSPDWDAALGPGWTERIMNVAESDRMHEKQGRSIVRWVVSDSLTVFLKRHFVLPRLHGWLARLFPKQAWSPGLQECDHLEWAKAAGIPVPRAVAAGEFRGRGGKLQSFLAIEELAGMLALHEAIPIASVQLSALEFAPWKRGLVGELARLCRELHRRRAFHRDLYLCHFFVREDDLGRVPNEWRGRVAMIDFHRLGTYRISWPVQQAKDLAQFLFSSFDLTGVAARDRARFWKFYREGDWGRAARPSTLLRSIVRWKAARYGRHNAKHDLAVPRKD